MSHTSSRLPTPVTRPLAFSTLGCPGLPLAEVAALAAGTGWRGLELRAAADEPVHVGLHPEARAAARAVLRDGGAEPLVVASYVRVADGAADDRAIVSEALAHARLAEDLGCPYVRVFPGAVEADPPADARAARRLRAIAAELPPGVTVLLETHDSHPRGADVARILAEVGHPRVGALWDVLHPWRYGEPVGETAIALQPWLAHVQIKDARSPQDLRPVMLGDGAVPLAAVFETLRERGYNGALALEWEAKWYPDAPPLAEALRLGTAWLSCR
ncbi:sugar phosphate isomerase/epimerase family protein [Micromonospora sp. LZ34]